MIPNQNQKQQYYTYKITFIDGYYYFGSRQCKVKPEDDVYWGSPKTHKDKWNTMMYFKTIMNVFEVYEDARLNESYLIGDLHKTDPLCLNKHNGKDFHNNRPHTQETKRKLSEVAKGRMHSEETREKMSLNRIGSYNNFYGKEHTKESKKRMSEKHKNKILKDTTKQKISNFISRTIWIHNNIVEKRLAGVEVPAGWTKGRLPGQVRNRSRINSNKGIS